MSYIVEIVRPISKAEALARVAGDGEFAVSADGDDWAELVWSRGSERALFSLSKGRITLTTPSDAALEKASALAAELGARVLGEEDDLRKSVSSNSQGSVRSTWIGWPVLVVVLFALLMWRW